MNRRNYSALTRTLTTLLVLCCWWTTDLQAQCGANTATGTSCTRSAFFDAQYNADQGCGAYRTITNYSPGEYFRMPVLLGGCYTIQTCGNAIDTQISCFQGTGTTGPFAFNDDNGPICGGTQASVNFVPNFTDYTRVDVRQYNCRPGGTSSITVRIRQNNNLSITSSAASMCEGQTRSLTATPARTVATPLAGSGNRGTFSGTGVSGTTFTAPTPSGASQNYTITYTFGFCTRTQSITVFRNPTTSNAGPNQTVINPNATLAGNTPSIGTGAWSVVNGTGTFANANAPGTTVSGLSVGTNTFRWTITNGNCTASFDDVIITYQPDNTPPSVTCPPTQTETFNSNCQFSLPDYRSVATITDNADPNPQVFQQPAPGTILAGNGGTTTQTITIVALDASNNSASCTFTVNIEDNVAPSVTCPGTQTLSADGNCAASLPDFTSLASVSDNCSSVGNISVTQSPPAGSVISSNTTVTISATDQSNNSSSCSFAVNLEDTVSPNAVCQDITVQLDAGGTASFTAADINGGSSDNCTSVGNLVLSASPASFSCAALGTQTALLTVTDQAGNSTTCQANVTVEDNISPNAVCQATSTLYLDANGSAVLNSSLVDGGSSDNCGIASSSVSDTSFDCTNLGSNSVTLTVVDASGNVATCTTPVTVSDSIAPVIVNCPADTTVSNVFGNCNATVFWTAPSASDNCNLTSLTSSAMSGSLFPVGATVVTYTAVDQSGNTSTCSFTVTVIDDEAPELFCPANVMAPADTGQCAAVVNWAPVNPSDNCTLDTVFSTRPNGDTFNVGTTAVFYVATDIYSNSDTCSFDVTVMDQEAPAVVCPPNLSVNNDSGFCSAVVTWNPGSASDNCGIDTITGTAASGDVFPVGSTPVTLTASDFSGNTDSCTFTVDVADTQAPVVFCPSPITVNNDNGLCGASVTWNPSTVLENCGMDTIISSAMSGDTFPVGVTTVTVLAIDLAQNIDSCSYDVTVIDAEAPQIICPLDTTLLADSSCTVAAGWDMPLASDNCGIDTVQASVALGTTLGVGQTSVTYAAIDLSGNGDTCSFTVTVDATPLVLASTVSSQVCGFGVTCNGATDGTATATSQGGCQPYSYQWSTGDSTASVSGLGAGSYTVTVTDGNNTTTVDTIVVTEPDALAATITGDSVICLGVNDGDLDLTVTGGADCTGYTYAWSSGDSTEDVSGLADGTYTVTVTDDNGCSTTATATIFGIPAPSPGLGGNQTVCAGNSVNLDAGLGFASYDWSTGDTTQAIAVTATGTYSVTVTNVLGCVGSDSVTVSNFPVAGSVITPGGASNVCQGDSVTLSALSGFTNLFWSTGESTPSIVVQAPGGTISIEATDANGCSVNDSVEVTFNPNPNPTPVIVPGPLVNLCEGSTVTLDAGSFATYAWSTGDSGQTIDVSSAGTYDVTVTNADGCSGVSGAVSVGVALSPVPAIVQSNDSLLATGGNFVTYQWLLNGSVIPGGTDDFAVPTTSGTYAVTVTDSNGCEGTSDTTFIVVGAEAAANNLLGIDLYPNPSSGLVFVRTMNPINWDVNIVVTDMYGKVIRVFDFGTIQNKVELDLTDVANGMYILKIRDEKGRSNAIRFVIE